MTPDIENPEGRFSQTDLVAPGHGLIQGSDAGDLLRADDGAAGHLFQPRIAAGMIGMPMSIVYTVKSPPAAGVQVGQDGLGVRRVDRGDLAGGVVAHQKAVVVDQAGELTDG